MLRIGALQLDTPFVQAALSGYSDLPMRRLARRYGAAYTLHEVVLDKLVLQRGKTRKKILQVADDDHPVGAQLMGAAPESFAPAAFDLAQAGYDAIDLNFACPVRKVLGRRRGGFLLSEPDTALEIIRRVYEAVGSTHPVTVKLRRGMDDSSESEGNFFEILEGAFAIGVAAATVHGRTVRQRYSGPSSWPFLARVRERFADQVVLGSGDLFSAESCLRMMRETGVEGVSIARGAIGNPWIFRECHALWRGRKLPPPPSVVEQGEAIAGHWTDAREVYGDKRAARIMRKFGIKYSELHPKALEVRDAFVATRTREDFERVLRTWYDPTVAWPPGQRRRGYGDLIAAGATS